MSGEKRPEEVAWALASEIHRVLGDQLVGLYLYGSAVSGGFDPGVSDIDLVAVTSRDLGMMDIAALDQMQQSFVERHRDWSNRLEIVYIGWATLRSFRTNRGMLAVISPGEQFHVRSDGVAQWLQNWYLVRETGTCLHGPDAAAIVPPISWSEFVAAVVRYAVEVRARSRIGVSAGSLAYTVLTMCRALRTVSTQTHGSKQQAAAWTRERLPEWAWLIDAALACRMSGGTVGFDDARSRTAAETFFSLVTDEILAGSRADHGSGRDDRER